jgi:serine/threonine protein kinase
MEVLRVSMLAAEGLRKIHDAGGAHGAVCPRNVELSEGTVALAEGPADTAYAAPEVLAGHKPDARSDIYSFGMLVFEMFTGRRPVGTESTGSPAVDRLVTPCLATDRDERTSRMQKVILELKLLTAAARRVAAALTAKDFEKRLVRRLEAQERAVAEMQRSVGEAVAILRGQVSSMRERAVKPELNAGGLSLTDRVAALEQTLETMKQHACEFEQSVAADLMDVEESLRKQTAAMDAARTQISQTNDIVERMAKTLEALRRAVLEHDAPGDSSMTVN